MKKSNLNNIEFGNENVQDILDRNPHWILRNGISFIFILLIVFLIGSYFIKYPERKIFEITFTKSIITPEMRKDKKLEMADTLNYVGKIRIPHKYLHKIENGQDVLIKIFDYSNNKNINIQCNINSIYIISNSDYFIAETILPLKLIGAFQENSEFKGTALLATGEVRLLLKIYLPLKGLIKESDEDEDK